jgi:hypothetical protein
MFCCGLAGTGSPRGLDPVRGWGWEENLPKTVDGDGDGESGNSALPSLTWWHVLCFFFSDFRGFVRQSFIFLLCLEKHFDFDLPLSFDLYCAVLFSFFCFRFIAFMEQQGIEGYMEMANLNDTVMVSDF